MEGPVPTQESVVAAPGREGVECAVEVEEVVVVVVVVAFRRSATGREVADPPAEVSAPERREMSAQASAREGVGERAEGAEEEEKEEGKGAGGRCRVLPLPSRAMLTPSSAVARGGG